MTSGRPRASPHGRPGVVSPQCSKALGVVRRVWIRRDDGVLYPEDEGAMDRRVSSLGLLAGVLTRFTAASFIVIILGAITTFHFSHGFFMN